MTGDKRFFKMAKEIWIAMIITGCFSISLCAEEMPVTFATRDMGWLAQTGTGAIKIYDTKKERESYYIYSAINRIGFVRRKPVIPSGRIFKVKYDKDMISTGDTVYIRPMRNTEMIIGRYYTTYKTLELSEDKETARKFGTQYYPTGIVEIIKKEPHFAVGRVTQTYRTIEMDNLLIPYTEKSPKIFIKEPPPDIDGEIIGTEERANMIAENAIVFIDKGTKDGVEPGQHYNIYYQESALPEPGRKTIIRLDPVDFGGLFVLHAEENTATAVITKSERVISVGTRFHTP